NTLFSGPAGGVIATAGLGKRVGIHNLIAFDMGGTSTDVCLIREGEPAKKNQREMAGMPVRARTLDIHTIGAGGGSLAWVDPGGLMKVGPQSAGAIPGPAGYGRGGDRPTVTDANLVLGRLNQKTLLNGRMAVYPDRAVKAVESIAKPLGLDLVQAAAGIVSIVNVNMMGAVRVVSVEQGEDPRDYTLVAFGGAGPLHAADIAREMGIRRVFVPPHPGLLSALGLLHADTRGDFSLTRILVATPAAIPSLRDGLADLAQRGQAWIAGEGVAGGEVAFEWQMDMRYLGQAFELILPMPSDRMDEEALATMVSRFHARHREFNGYDVPEHPVEIVNLRLVVTAHRPSAPPETAGSARARLADAVLDRRRVWFAETGYVETPVYDRDRLPADAMFAGPAIIEQMDATTVVPPEAEVQTDAFGNLFIEVKSAVGRLEVSEWAEKLTL
ncbi:MAG: hydantoinase/oxoprolinase family protein, partial [Alphaproteobacteria bacterium]